MLEENMMIAFLKRFQACPFRIKMGDREYRVGEGEEKFTVIFHKELSFSSLMISTSLALGEAYMDGDLEIEGDLYEALKCFLGQMEKFSTDRAALKKLMYTSLTKKNQKQEVQSHYDIGNDFYRLWLDETMSYSCGYFRSTEDTLYEAQKNKVDYILKKLYLKEGMNLLDVGCGWGFLLIEAAKKYGVHGMGITLSKEQYQEVQKRIRAEKLEEQIRVELMDYRDLPKYGKYFDRVVSVGMVEHVGRENYPLFLECVKEVLKPGGVFLLHFISALKEYPGDAWMKKYIFPGGMIPSLREMISYAAEYEFHTVDAENLRLHYHKTLCCWRNNFLQHKEEVRAQFDERFVRMWELYLASCAAAFYNGIVDIHQVLFTNGKNNELPMVRWY